MQSMAQALNNVEKRELYYGGNLRRDKNLKSLTHHHFIVPNCDDLGNLLPAYVFVQFIGIKRADSFDHLLICKQFNEEAESLQQILMQGKFTEDFLIDQKKIYCIHSKTISTFDPQIYFEVNDSCFPY